MGLTTPQAMFDILDADIVIMQETKIQRKDLRDDIVLVPGWDVFFSLPKHKKGTYRPSSSRAFGGSPAQLWLCRVFWSSHLY